MFIVVAFVLISLAAGVALERRIGGAAARVWRERIVRLMLFVLMPFVAYVSIARLHPGGGFAVGLVLALVLLATLGFAMFWLARGPLGLDRPSTGAAIVCVIQANTGFFGLPLVAALFSQAEFTQSVAYDALVSSPTFILGSFTVGALFGTAGGDRHIGRHVITTLLRNPVLYAVAAALLVPESWAPEALVTPSKIAVYLLVPLGFIVVGITLSDEADEGEFRFPPPLSRPIAAVVALRMMVMPVIVLAVSLFVIRLPGPYPLLAAMPSGVNCVLVAHQTGLNLRLSADAIAWTTMIALAATSAVGVAQAFGLL
ncbi:AEC family transporter [Conexibacter sp. JD483]|uniref:AEC family transporter n=1 Tax=unclassified Conexibacter TaxID=2627773 RepID=UPI002724564E|nr:MULTISPECIES: AEC family transporter [unclassified Conexibacter]MDO8189511.1 AEC family transporter [Conexibacter sp. CPCC 205706]MDO8202093.1 AEC family transporter [Conexibacter sp. CPCC 205762]MDR9372819.1 AEC family transporter [Conexibacter sp. JD483]